MQWPCAIPSAGPALIRKPSCLVSILSPPLSQPRTWPRKGDFLHKPTHIHPSLSELAQAESCGCLQFQSDGDLRGPSTLGTPRAPSPAMPPAFTPAGLWWGLTGVWEGSAFRTGSEERMRQMAPWLPTCPLPRSPPWAPPTLPVLPLTLQSPSVPPAPRQPAP